MSSRIGQLAVFVVAVATTGDVSPWDRATSANPNPRGAKRDIARPAYQAQPRRCESQCTRTFGLKATLRQFFVSHAFHFFQAVSRSADRRPAAARPLAGTARKRRLVGDCSELQDGEGGDAIPAGDSEGMGELMS